MDKREMQVIVQGVVKLLESIRSHKVSVIANPYVFEDICLALERRATFLRNVITSRGRGKGKVTVRRRLYGPNNQISASIVIKDGVPMHKRGGKLLKPNGQPWTAKDLAVVKAQHAYRMLQKTTP